MLVRCEAAETKQRRRRLAGACRRQEKAAFWCPFWRTGRHYCGGRAGPAAATRKEVEGRNSGEGKSAKTLQLGERNSVPRGWMTAWLDQRTKSVGTLITHWMDDASTGCQQQTCHCRVLTCAGRGRWGGGSASNAKATTLDRKKIKKSPRSYSTAEVELAKKKWCSRMCYSWIALARSGLKMLRRVEMIHARKNGRGRIDKLLTLRRGGNAVE